MKPHWKCTICGLVGDSPALPDHCPECGAVKAMFVPTDEPPHGIAHNPIQPHDRLAGEAFGPGGSGCVYED